MSWSTIGKYALYNFFSKAQISEVLRMAGAEKAYEKVFYGSHGRDNWFYGYFTSYESAATAVLADRASGWNNDNSAKHYINPSDQPSSYATLFWLHKIITDNSCIVDFGGGVGQMYHRFLNFSNLSEKVKWHIIEVPSAVKLGKKRAVENKSTHLLFSTELKEAPECDILHSAGCLQYMNNAAPWILETVRKLPRWIIINKIILTDKNTFWTLQNFSSGVTPYQIYNKKNFISYFKDHGYTMRDCWDVRELSVKIPFHPRRYISSGAGFCFELQK